MYIDLLASDGYKTLVSPQRTQCHWQKPMSQRALVTDMNISNSMTSSARHWTSWSVFDTSFHTHNSMPLNTAGCFGRQTLFTRADDAENTQIIGSGRFDWHNPLWKGVYCPNVQLLSQWIANSRFQCSEFIYYPNILKKSQNNFTTGYYDSHRFSMSTVTH